MAFKLLRPRTLLGVDIQSDAVRLVNIRKKRNGYALLYAASRALPMGVVTDGRIKQFDVLSEALTEMVQCARFEGMPAALGLAANQVHVRDIRLPARLIEEEIEAEIRIQLQRELPGLKDTLQIDFVAMPSTDDYQRVSFAAVRESYLANVLNAIQSAGLVVKVVDIDRVARERAVSLYPEIAVWFSSAHSIEDIEFLNQPEKFITACGLAMREVPRW